MLPSNAEQTVRRTCAPSATRVADRPRHRPTTDECDVRRQVHDEGPVPPEADATSWPCKMNGCSKVFAREADLKRHQRTTRSHSVPSLYVVRAALARRMRC